MLSIEAPPSPSISRPARSDRAVDPHLGDAGRRGSRPSTRPPRSAGSSRGCGTGRRCIRGCSPASSGMRSSSTMISWPSRSTTGRVAAKYSGTTGDVLAPDVAPDVHLGPVRQREYAHRLAVGELGVGRAPELRSLLARLPAVAGLAQAEDPLLGARPLLVAAGAADRRVVAALVQRLAQRDGLHDPRVLVRAVAERASRPRRRPRGWCATSRSSAVSRAIRSRNSIISRNFQVVSMCRTGKGTWPGANAFGGQVQQDRGVLADAVEHHRATERSRGLAQDVDRLGLEGVEDGIRCDGRLSGCGHEGKTSLLVRGLDGQRHCAHSTRRPPNPDPGRPTRAAPVRPTRPVRPASGGVPFWTPICLVRPLPLGSDPVLKQCPVQPAAVSEPPLRVIPHTVADQASAHADQTRHPDYAVLLADSEAFVRLVHAGGPGPRPGGRPASRRTRRDRGDRHLPAHPRPSSHYGARVAWRNSARCIGRLYWRQPGRPRPPPGARRRADGRRVRRAPARCATNDGRIRPRHHGLRAGRPGDARPADLERAAHPLRRLRLARTAPSSATRATSAHRRRPARSAGRAVPARRSTCCPWSSQAADGKPAASSSCPATRCSRWR